MALFNCSALKSSPNGNSLTGPFIFSFEPPELVLSHCNGERIAAGGPEGPPGRPGS